MPVIETDLDELQRLRALVPQHENTIAWLHARLTDRDERIRGLQWELHTLKGRLRLHGEDV